MLKIRLSKTGKKNAPSYRIVVIPKERPRDGEAIEVLGHFNPVVTPPIFSLNKERLKYWLDRGAQLTEAVKKIAEGKYEFRRYHPKRREAVTEEAKETREAEPGKATKAAPEKTREEEGEKKPVAASDNAKEEKGAEEKEAVKSN